MNKPVNSGHAWDTGHTVSLDKGKDMPRKTRRQLVKGGLADEEYSPAKFTKKRAKKAKPKKRR